MKNLFHWRNLPPFLILMLSGAMAFAQSVTADGMLGAVSSTDLAGKVLSSAFGESFYNTPGMPGSGSDSVFGAMFSTFNAGLLAVGVFWFAYNVASATVQTAEGGEFMGQRFSTIWLPIRFGVGISALVPMFGGFCGAQVIMMYFAKMGIGLANLGIAAAIGALGSFNTATASINQNAQETAKAMFASNLCMAALKKDIAASADASLVAMDSAVVTKSGDGLTYVYSRSSDMAEGGDMACGTVGVKFSSTPASGGSLDLSGIKEAAVKAHAASLSTMNSAMGVLAAKYLAASENGGASINFDNEFGAAAANYNTAVQTAMKSQVAEQASKAMAVVTNDIKQRGWMMLGSWYQTLATVSSTISNVAAVKASVTSPSSPNSFAYHDTYSQALGNLKSISAIESEKHVDGGTDSIFGKIWSGQGIINRAASWAITGDISGTSTANPLIEFKNMGDDIVWAGSAIITGYGVARAGAVALQKMGEAASNQPIAGAAAVPEVGILSAVAEGLSVVGPLVYMASMALFFFGVMLSTYIPMLPFIVWFGGIMAWFANTIEGLIAAPVGAFVHLEAEGDGMGQRSQHSYMFLFGVLLRPILMVFGFFAASFAVKVLGTILLVLFAPALANAQGNSMTGLVMILAYLAIFVSLALTLIHGSFNLIHIIPDQVIAWAGGHISGTMGKDTDDRAKNVFVGGISSIKNAGIAREGRKKGPADAVPAPKAGSEKAAANSSARD